MMSGGWNPRSNTPSFKMRPNAAETAPVLMPLLFAERNILSEHKNKSRTKSSRELPIWTEGGRPHEDPVNLLVFSRMFVSVTVIPSIKRMRRKV